jgi:glycosyltransferase involved in cell wall biosynthesis
MNYKISVIICTYNPTVSIFIRCLEAIKNASNKLKPHEIIIIDNNSNNDFIEDINVKRLVCDLNIKYIIEKKQGLTPARIKGIEESSGNLLLFIDDDNFIENNFFEEGNDIALNYPFIGSWSGNVNLEFEVEPPKWSYKYHGLLVKRNINKNFWSNMPNINESMPCGAGLFVRKEVADYYLHLHNADKRKIQLDRSVGSLFSGGDNDLAACACDIGMGIGLFNSISLIHYIPKFRLELTYLLNLAKGISASSIVLRFYRGEVLPERSFKNKIGIVLRFLVKNKIEREFYKAHIIGENIGLKLVNKTYENHSYS